MRHATWLMILAFGFASNAGCASLMELDASQKSLDKMEEAVMFMCENVSEADRLPLRAEMLKRFNVPTEGVCPFLAKKHTPG